MSTRKPYIGGNWKMNLHGSEANALAKDVAAKVANTDVQVTVFPAFPYLSQVKALLGDNVQLGAQDAYFQANGAYTGEVSLSQLKDVGVQVILVGHSERRHVIGECDSLINTKVRASLEAGFEVILCVGETLEQRDTGMTDAVNIAQTTWGLAGVTAVQAAKVTIAYEPVWAIGTGKTATAQDAQNAHKRIRKAVADLLGNDVASAMRIQYGGSVKPANAKELFAQPDIDGGLIGGAALKAEDFVGIVDAAR